MNILILSLVIVVVTGSQLISSIVLVGSGSASPLHPLPTRNWNDWDEKGPFQLTGAGMREQYLLGKELRRRYEKTNLISEEHLFNQVMFRSIDHNSNIESSEAFIRGFLLNKTIVLNDDEQKAALPGIHIDEKLIKELGNNMLPFGMSTLPFHTYYPHDEDLFDSCFCPNANNLTLESFLSSQRVKRARDAYEEKFIQAMKRVYKFEDKFLEFPEYVKILTSITDIIKQYKYPGLLSVDDIRLVKDFAEELLFDFNAGNALANSYRAVPILSFVSTIFQAASNSSSVAEAFKLGVIFTQNEMLQSFLSFVSRRNVTEMPTSSILSLQLLVEDSGEQIVKFRYNEEEIRIAGCDEEYCEYIEFLGLVKSLQNEVGDLSKKCTLATPQES